jgi:hypothetical protein
LAKLVIPDPAGHVILHRVDLLPGALLGVIREIFRR